MSKHEKRLLSILTVNRYVTDIIDIINEILTDAPDSTLVLFNFYARDFRQIKSGFYSSKELLMHLCNAYTGRMVRLYSMENNISLTDIENVFNKTETTIAIAAEKIQKYYYNKYGDVSAAEIYKVNIVVSSIIVDIDNEFQKFRPQCH